MSDVTRESLLLLGRTTLALAGAVLLVGTALRLLRLHSPTAHRAGCVLALLVGWSFLRYPLDVPWYEAPTAAPQMVASDGETHEPSFVDDDSTVAARLPGEDAALLAPPLNFATAPQEEVNGEGAHDQADSSALPVNSEPAVEQHASYDFASASDEQPARIGETAAVGTATTADSRSANAAWPLAVLATWLSGACFLVLLWCSGYVRFVRRLPAGQAVEGAWLAEWSELLRAAGVPRAIPLRVTADLGPLLCRLPRRYELLVPAELWNELESRERRAILRHELAHYTRGDVWKSLLVRVLALPHWFNPLAWSAVRRFDEAAEWACDRAATRDEPVSSYATALVRLGGAGGRPASYRPAARGRTLKTRIRRLLAGRSQHDPVARKLIFFATALSIAALALVRVELVAKESAEDDATKVPAPTVTEDVPREETFDSSAPASLLAAADIEQPAGPTAIVGQQSTSGVQALMKSGVENIQLSPEQLAARGLSVVPVAAVQAGKMQRKGLLELDPERVARVAARSSGEIVEIGNLMAPGGAVRPLRYGDAVEKNQLLARISSKDLAEKKSELVEALVRDRREAEKIQRVNKLAASGSIAAEQLREAQRDYEDAKLAVARARRTLRAWRLADADIEAVVNEAEKPRPQGDPNAEPADRDWSVYDVRAPLAGVILEKNAAVGDIVEGTSMLFKIGDLSRLAVTVPVGEAGLLALRKVPEDQRRWEIQPLGKPVNPAYVGTFDNVDQAVVEPNNATMIKGSVENTDGRLKSGQYVTVTYDTSADPALIAVPNSAVVDNDRGQSVVFVGFGGNDTDFAPRQVAPVRNAGEMLLVRSQPTDAERARGAAPLVAGEKVLVASARQQTAAIPQEKPQPAERKEVVETSSRQPRMVERGKAADLVKTAALGYQAALAAYEAGTIPLQEVCNWSLRWKGAEENQELISYSERMSDDGPVQVQQIRKATPDQRAAAERAHLERMQKLQERVTKLYEAGARGGEAELKALVDYYVADAQRRLQPVESEAAHGRVAAPGKTGAWRQPAAETSSRAASTTPDIAANTDGAGKEQVAQPTAEARQAASAQKEETLRQEYEAKNRQLIRQLKEIQELQQSLHIIDADDAVAQHQLLLTDLSNRNNALYALMSQMADLDAEIDRQKLALSLLENPAAREARAAEAIERDERMRKFEEQASALAELIADGKEGNDGKESEEVLRMTRQKVMIEKNMAERRDAVMKRFLASEEALKLREVAGRLSIAERHRARLAAQAEDLNKQIAEIRQQMQKLAQGAATLRSQKQQAEALKQALEPMQEELHRLWLERQNNKSELERRSGAATERQSVERKLAKLRELHEAKNISLQREMQDIDKLKQALGTSDRQTAATQNQMLQTQANMINNSLFALRSQLTSLDVEIEKCKLDVALAQDPRAKEAQTEEAIHKDDKLTRLADQLSDTQAAISETQKMTKEGADNPAVKRLTKQRVALEEKIAARRDELMKRFADPDADLKLKESQGKLVTAEKHRDTVQKQIEDLTGEAERISKQATKAVANAAELDRRMENLQALHQVVEQLSLDIQLLEQELAADTAPPEPVRDEPPEE